MKFNWEKLGRIYDPAMAQDKDWRREFAQSPTVLIFDTYVRVYFCCRPLPDAKGQYVSRMAFFDLDRANLTRIVRLSQEPALCLGKRGTFDEFGTNPVSVIRHGNDLRVYYAGVTRCESVPFNAAIGVAVSHDNGETFTRIGDGPVLSYTPDEPFVIGSPRIRFFDNRWVLWYSAALRWVRGKGRPEPVYRIRMAFSDDGINWKKVGHDLLEIKLEPDECQACADVFFLNDQYHMFFSYRYNFGFKDPGRGYRIGYASSNDLIHWSRDDANAGIDRSPVGWDSEMASYAHVFQLDGSWYALYQGNGLGRAGIGLAKLVSTVT